MLFIPFPVIFKIVDTHMRVLVGIVYGVAAVGIVAVILRLVLLVTTVNAMNTIALLSSIELSIHIFIATLPAISGIIIRWISPRLKSKASRSSATWKKSDRSKDLSLPQNIESKAVISRGHQKSQESMTKSWSHTSEQKLDGDFELNMLTEDIPQSGCRAFSESTEEILKAP